MSVVSLLRHGAVAVAVCLILAACTASPPASPVDTPGGPTPTAGGPADTPQAPTEAPSTPTPEAPAERVTFRIASDNNPSEPVIRCGVDPLAEELADLFDVQIFHSAQLGQAAQVLQLVAANQFEASMVGAGQLQAFWGPMGIFSAIYVIDDHEHAQRVWDGPIGDDLRAGLAEASNLQVANFYWYGTRQLTSNKPIRTPADMEGVRLRVSPGSEIAFTNGTAMGGNPTTLPFGELYLGLSQGVVDAQENPLPTIDGAKFYEVQDYLNLTNHEPSPQFLVSNVDFFNSLSPEHREAFEAAARNMSASVLDCVLEAETNLLETWRAEGTWSGGIIDDVDVAAFRAQAEPVLLEAYSETWAPLDLYNRIRAESNQ
jgi:tripartite ATP-independent transporter DctP family solute receptor